MFVIGSDQGDQIGLADPGRLGSAARRTVVDLRASGALVEEPETGFAFVQCAIERVELLRAGALDRHVSATILDHQHPDFAVGRPVRGGQFLVVRLDDVTRNGLRRFLDTNCERRRRLVIAGLLGDRGLVALDFLELGIKPRNEFGPVAAGDLDQAFERAHQERILERRDVSQRCPAGFEVDVHTRQEQVDDPKSVLVVLQVAWRLVQVPNQRDERVTAVLEHAVPVVRAEKDAQVVDPRQRGLLQVSANGDVLGRAAEGRCFVVLLDVNIDDVGGDSGLVFEPDLIRSTRHFAGAAPELDADSEPQGRQFVPG